MASRSALQPILALLCVSACGSPPVETTPSDSNILLTLQGVPARAASLVVSATLDGRAASNSDTYSPPPSDGRIGINLPPTISGTLKVAIDSFDSDGCKNGSGELTTALPQATLLTTPFSITTKQPRQCGSVAPCASNTLCADTSPATSPVRGLWSISPKDIWAVGDLGLIMHFDGTAWTTTTGVTTKDLTAVWASSATDVWAVGTTGTVLRYNGTNWTVGTAGTANLKGVFGTGPTDVWAAGEVDTFNYAILRHYDGTSWKMVDPIIGSVATVNAIWTSAPNFIYACGAATTTPTGLLFRWDGSSWNKITSNATAPLRALWGTGRGNLVAVGDGGTFLRYDDSQGWQNVSGSFTSTASLYAVTGDANRQTLAVGDNGTVISVTPPYMPSAFSTFTLPGKFLRAVTIGSNGIAWVGGTSSFLGHIDLRP